MVSRVKQDPKGKRNYRAEMDSKLYIRQWEIPGKPKKSQLDNAPMWWHGEEEASNSFLESMGVRL